jgi:hypothetical protein
MAEKCSICGTPIDEDAITQAVEDYPSRIGRDDVEAYHLECAITDGSYITAEEVTEEDRQPGGVFAAGVYLLEKL